MLGSLKIVMADVKGVVNQDLKIKLLVSCQIPLIEAYMIT
jgi:hypothetical protein